MHYRDKRVEQQRSIVTKTDPGKSAKQNEFITFTHDRKTIPNLVSIQDTHPLSQFLPDQKVIDAVTVYYDISSTFPESSLKEFCQEKQLLLNHITQRLCSLLEIKDQEKVVAVAKYIDDCYQHTRLTKLWSSELLVSLKSMGREENILPFILTPTLSKIIKEATQGYETSDISLKEPFYSQRNLEQLVNQTCERLFTTLEIYTNDTVIEFATAQQDTTSGLTDLREYFFSVATSIESEALLNDVKEIFKNRIRKFLIRWTNENDFRAQNRSFENSYTKNYALPPDNVISLRESTIGTASPEVHPWLVNHLSILTSQNEAGIQSLHLCPLKTNGKRLSESTVKLHNNQAKRLLLEKLQLEIVISSLALLESTSPVHRYTTVPAQTSDEKIIGQIIAETGQKALIVVNEAGLYQITKKILSHYLDPNVIGFDDKKALNPDDKVIITSYGRIDTCRERLDDCKERIVFFKDGHRAGIPSSILFLTNGHTDDIHKFADKEQRQFLKAEMPYTVFAFSTTFPSHIAFMLEALSLNSDIRYELYKPILSPLQLIVCDELTNNHSFLLSTGVMIDDESKRALQQQIRINALSQNVLKRIEDSSESKIVIAANSLDENALIVKRLRNAGASVIAYTGEVPDSKRYQIIEAFKNEQWQVLVVSEVADGIKVPADSLHIVHPPTTKEDLIHLLGIVSFNPQRPFTPVHYLLSNEVNEPRYTTVTETLIDEFYQVQQSKLGLTRIPQKAYKEQRKSERRVNLRPSKSESLQVKNKVYTWGGDEHNASIFKEQLINEQVIPENTWLTYQEIHPVLRELSSDETNIAALLNGYANEYGKEIVKVTIINTNTGKRIELYDPGVITRIQSGIKTSTPPYGWEQLQNETDLHDIVTLLQTSFLPYSAKEVISIDNKIYVTARASLVYQQTRTELTTVAQEKAPKGREENNNGEDKKANSQSKSDNTGIPKGDSQKNTKTRRPTSKECHSAYQRTKKIIENRLQDAPEIELAVESGKSKLSHIAHFEKGDIYEMCVFLVLLSESDGKKDIPLPQWLVKENGSVSILDLVLCNRQNDTYTPQKIIEVKWGGNNRSVYEATRNQLKDLELLVKKSSHPLNGINTEVYCFEKPPKQLDQYLGVTVSQYLVKNSRNPLARLIQKELSARINRAEKTGDMIEIYQFGYVIKTLLEVRLGADITQLDKKKTKVVKKACGKRKDEITQCKSLLSKVSSIETLQSPLEYSFNRYVMRDGTFFFSRKRNFF